MAAFSTADLSAADLDRIAAYLRTQCSGKPKDIYASNCATCHGPTGGGGVGGPNIRCSEAGEFGSALRSGEDGMPVFRTFTSAQVSGLSSYVHGWCALGGGGGGD
jgi:mono/diheme cytochrome c family protein